MSLIIRHEWATFVVAPIEILVSQPQFYHGAYPSYQAGGYEDRPCSSQAEQ